MKWSFITLFPDVIHSYTTTSMMGRAREAGLIDVEVVNPRDFSKDPHKKVDDSPYGGGAGMVMTCQPLDDAFQSLHPLKEKTMVFLTSPTGRAFNHQYALEIAKSEQVVLLCGHYEGFDERIKSVIPDLREISIGDYILTGGELAALCIMDTVCRLLSGVVQKAQSVEEDSFFNGLLDYPHYTRPSDYKGFKVPEVLLSGNHKEITRWRRKMALERSFLYRPDLVDVSRLTAQDKTWILELLSSMEQS